MYMILAACGGLRESVCGLFARGRTARRHFLLANREAGRIQNKRKR